MKFNLDFLKKQKTNTNEYKEVVQDLQYDEFSKKEKFSSFEQIVNNSLLENNMSRLNPLFKDLLQKVNEGIEAKYDFVLGDFVVTWIQNKRFSKSLLVPAITGSENPNVEAVNFSYSNNDEIATFLSTFNEIANDLIEKDQKVEILPNIIVYKSNETKALKIAFAPEIING